MNTAVMFSSQTCEWATPEGLFQDLDTEFHFTLDACAIPDNAKVTNFHSGEEVWSALIQPWEGVVWCNPPYGRQIGDWIAKALGSSEGGSLVVCHLPARTDTAWWHDYVMKADEIRFIRGRLKFGGAAHNAPFPSAIAIFRPKGSTDASN